MSQVKIYMRTELCNFSGYKIYPGHGIRYVRLDGKLLIFLNTKSESLFLNKTNPRKVSWTVLYRKLHKKGHIEEIQKKRAKKTAKQLRPIDSNSIANIMARKNQTADYRKTQRETAIKAAKEQTREKREKKKVVQKEVQARVTQKNITRQTKDRAKQPKTAKTWQGGKR